MTEELTLPGFRHDTFSSVYPAAAASPVFARMPLERHGLRWSHPGACYAHPLPGGRAIALYRDLDRTAASLDAAGAPGDGDGWRAFAEPLIERWDAVRDVMLSPFLPVLPGLRMLGRLGPARTVDFLRLVPGTARGLGRRLFTSGDARAWLYSSAGHSDAPPSDPGSGIAVAYLNLLGHAVGWPSPEGGAGRLADALVALPARARRRGPLRRPRHPRARGGRRVTGVELAGGERCRRVVVADVMPHALAAWPATRSPRRYRSLLRYRYGPATLKVDWALDGPIPWQAPARAEAGTVHVGGDEHELAATIAASHHRLPERPFLLLGQQTLADPTRAPAGKHTAWAYTHGPRAASTGAPSRTGTSSASRRTSSPTPPGSAIASSPATSWDPPTCSAQRQPRRGDVGGGTYRLRQVLLPPDAEALAVHDARDRALPGQRGRVPRRRGARRSGDAAARAALRG